MIYPKICWNYLPRLSKNQKDQIGSSISGYFRALLQLGWTDAFRLVLKKQKEEVI